MTDRDRQDHQAWFRDEGLEWCGIDSEEQLTWRAFQAALRIAEERRKQEEPVAWMDPADEQVIDFHQKIDSGHTGEWDDYSVPLILRDRSKTS